jgi:Leucine-rich repeat (LRR) protein
MKLKLQIVLFTLFSIIVQAQNLVVNGSAEEFPIYDNGWTYVSGDFTSRLAETSSQDGIRYFYANQSSLSEIFQEIDLSSMITEIDAGQKTFKFSCHFRSFTAGLDESQAIVEYLDETANVLSTYDTGLVISPTGWIEYSDIRVAPIGTRTIKVTLIATKNFGNNNDGYIDNVVLEDFSEIAIPDSNFEQALINDSIDSDGIINGTVLLSDIIDIDFLDVSSESISDLTGLEYFFGLTSLIADNNTISSINLSNNTQLTGLVVSSNQLTNLDLSANTNLVSLIISDNLFTDLDVSLNQNITQLFADNNQFGFIDLSQLSLLEQVSVSGNTISNLSLSLNPNLQFINVSNNTLTSLNIRNGNSTVLTNENVITTGNPNLNCITVDNVNYSTTTWTNIDAQINFAIDCIASNPNNLLYNGSAEIIPVIGNGWVQVTGNTTGRLVQSDFLDGIRYFYANESPFAELYQDIDLSQYAMEIDSGLKSYTFSCYFQSFDQPNPDDSRALLEYKDINGNVLESYDTGYSSIVSEWTKFEDIRLAPIGTRSVRVTLFQQRTFGTNNDGYIDDVVFQESPVINIPDPNFEQALIDFGIDSDGIINQEVFQSDIIDILILDLNNQSISDLTGLEGFLSLQIFSASDNNLTILDLSANDELLVLELNNNQLTTIDVSNNVNLGVLRLESNLITEIDITANTILQELYLDNNQLTQIVIGFLSLLERFSIANNNLVELDVSQNSALTELDCSDNDLFNLNVQNGNNSTITDANFNAGLNENLNCIQVDDFIYSNNNWNNIDTQTAFSTNCAPGNDDCFDAGVVDLGIITSGTTFGATSSTTFPSCQEDTIVLLDVWYQFTAPTSGAITAVAASILNSFDINMAIYDDCNDVEPISCDSGTIAITDLVPNQTYYIQIWVGGNLTRSPSNLGDNFTLDVQDTTTLSIVNINGFKNDIILTPNPASNQTTITSTNLRINSIQVFDITGKNVISINQIESKNKTVNTSKLAKGLYLLSIETEFTTITKKLLIK